MKKIFKALICACIALVSMFSLSACNGGDGNVQATVNKDLGDHYIINNAIVDLAASDSHTIVDKKSARAYTVYMASENKLGEGSELCKVAVYNTMQPTNVEWITAFDFEEDFGGLKITTCNIADIDSSTVRVYIGVHGENKYYYKDLNKQTLKIGEKKEVKYKSAYKSPAVNMTVDNVNAHIRELGGDEFNYVQMSSDMIKVDGTLYVAVAGGKALCQNFLFMESGDGITWSFVSMGKHAVSYEPMITYHDDKFWVMCRTGGTAPSNNTQQDLMYSEDMGKTWKQSNLALETSDTRPYIFTYQNELYLAYSSPLAKDYSAIRTWRCNIHVGKIVTNNGSQSFEEVIYKESKYGIVYYSLFDYYGKMIMLYSSGELHPEEGTMGGYTQGKDCLMYTILQEQDPILKIKR